MSPLKYQFRSIGSIRSLSKCLGISIATLINTANYSEEYYFPNEPDIKPDGSVRQTYSVIDPLKSIQDSILHKIIYSVEFPEYLQGGIKDKETPRDYIRDANLHLNGKTFLKFDISNFFTSIKTEYILLVWKNFFQFPREVAEILTLLTTYDNSLPQGAKTSSGLSNLIFWDFENEMERELREDGYIYSRYIDDITVSSTKILRNIDLEKITTKIMYMFNRYDLKINRKKMREAKKNKEYYLVHGLNIRSGKATVPRETRYDLRAAVHNLEETAKSSSSWNEIKDEHESLTGKINIYSRLHPGQARQYLEQLKNIKRNFLQNNE